MRHPNVIELAKAELVASIMYLMLGRERRQLLFPPYVGQIHSINEDGTIDYSASGNRYCARTVDDLPLEALVSIEKELQKRFNHLDR